MATNEIIIDLKSEYKIKIEKVEEFEKSIFSDVYKAARANVLNIVSQKIEKNEIDAYNNVIAFTGERGKGKSSAMISFQKGLIEIKPGNKNDFFFSEFYDKPDNERVKYNFLSLDVIDPSLFRGGETLFEIVLAKMFLKFKSQIEDDDCLNKTKISDDDRRKLVGEFQKVFENLKYTKGNHKDDLFRQEALDALINLSSSSNLRESFQSLIKTYLRVLCNNDGKNNFLIIAIDDFDLKIEGVYDMLEDVRQFLITENAIVLIACKMEQLREAVRASIYSKYIDLMCCNKDLLDRIFDEREINRGASKYIEKLFPSKSIIYLKDIFNLDLSKLIHGVPVEYRNDINHAILGVLYQKAKLFIKKESFSKLILLDNTLRSLSNFNTIISAPNSDLNYFLRNEILSEDFKLEKKEKLINLLDSKANLLKANFVNIISQPFKSRNFTKRNFLIFPRRIENVSLSDCNTIFQLIDENFNVFDENFKFLEYVKLAYGLMNNFYIFNKSLDTKDIENYTFINPEDISNSNRLKNSMFYKCDRDTFQTKIFTDNKIIDKLEDQVVLSAFVSHLGSKDIKFRNDTENIFERVRKKDVNNFKTFQFSVFELFSCVYKENFNLNKMFLDSEIQNESTKFNEYKDCKDKYFKSKYYHLFLNPYFVSEFYNEFIIACNNLNKHKNEGYPKLEENGIKKEDYHQILVDYFELSLKICFENLNKKYSYLELDFEDYIQLNFIIDLFINTKNNELIKEHINNCIKENLEPKEVSDKVDIDDILITESVNELKEFVNYLQSRKRFSKQLIDRHISLIKTKDVDIANYLLSFEFEVLKSKKSEIITKLNSLISRTENNGQSQE
jgi:hypothetical protein